MSEDNFYYEYNDDDQESEYSEEESETTQNERNVLPLQELSQKSQEPSQESPQEAFHKPSQEPFQEPPQEPSQEEDNIKKAKTYSDTWHYFNIQDPQYPTKVVCQKCKQTYSKSTGISTLKEYLKKVHRIVIDKIKKTQTKLNFPRVDPWPKEEMLVRDQALVEWITVDLQPFSVVTNNQFINLVNILDPRYRLPGKTSIKEKVVDHFDNMRKNIKLDVDKIPGKVSLTSDMWTSMLNNNSFLGLTIHFIDQEWNMQHFLLDIISFNDRHNTINITNTIMSVLAEFKIKEKVLALTTDNATTMLAVGRSIAEKLDDDGINSTFGHYRCAAHILNLAAQQGLELIDNAVIKVRQLMIKIKNSVIISDELRKLCKCAKINYLRPELDVRTRWNSTFNMLKKMEKMWNGVRMLAVRNQEVQMLMPTEEEWKIIEETMIILEPLERATVIIENDNFEQKELASSVNQKIDEYWTIINQQTLVSTVLDPRYKLSLFEAGTLAAEAVSAVTSLLANYNNVIIPENHDVDDSETPRQYFQRLKKRRLNHDDTSRRSSITSSISSVSNVSDELDRYLALQIDENVKPLLWWKAHEHEFSTLAKISRDYLSIQATSVACEQAFSVAGNTITKTRNRLNPETARATLCAKSWIENGVGILEKK
ncbi:zinc finger BED domain-containing protein RICESLEEPER 2-like [Rhizophagus clarus]|uniref:Zinc finger BED domain-containing protein RICESLEEPER 2-like n=1 Tax=Rhizophagus clarus TaxID=94130 RepID=A0A8H3QVY3_9GLOM|nr:zinc finger BED domain-containing protein RICESLEEPER 2-like [Rhizophagus clarus]